MSDIVFRRIKGKIIPIKKKSKEDKLKPDPIKGSLKVATGTGLAIFGGKSAAKDLSKSFKSFKLSAENRAISKLAHKGSATSSKFIKRSAIFKLAGRKLATKSRTKFGLALGLSGIVIGSGTSDFFRKDQELADEASGTIGTVVSAGVVGLAAKRFKLKAKSIDELFGAFKSRGRFLSKSKIEKIAKTKFDPNRPKKGRQLRFDF